jgi:hypothetical protein
MCIPYIERNNVDVGMAQGRFKKNRTAAFRFLARVAPADLPT